MTEDCFELDDCDKEEWVPEYISSLDAIFKKLTANSVDITELVANLLAEIMMR